MINHCDNDDYDIEQGRVAFQKELTGAMVRAGAREVELSGPRAAEQDTWKIGNLAIHGYRIYNEQGREVVTNIYRKEDAEQIITEHNTHATLVEQRDRLLEAIRDVAIRSLLYCEQKYDHDDQARLNLEALLTTIEQGVRNAGEGGQR